MGGIDWTDVWLHVIAAVAFTGLCAVLSGPGERLLWVAVTANAGFWPVREALQRASAGRPWLPWQWSAQKHLEAWPPAAAGIGVAAWPG